MSSTEFKEMITSPDQSLEGIRKRIKVFLAGPIQGAPDWQKEAFNKVDLGDYVNVVYFNPRRDVVSGKLSDADYSQQVSWETERLRISDVVLFWIPKRIEDIPGREYAQTTKLELLENLGRSKKVILGIEPEAVSGERYLKLKATGYGITKVHETLESCLTELDEYMTELGRKFRQQFFTSDTHFSSERTLKLSRRPFRNVSEMDWTMIERWNKVVPPGATVWHLGDFGDPGVIRYLNGHIRLVAGNYEVTEWKESGMLLTDWIEQKLEQGFEAVTMSTSYCDISKTSNPDNHKWAVALGHEPEKVKEEVRSGNFDYGLFGHIHGRQKVKRFGFDVGTDANDFTPVSEEDVRFYLGALDKGYYDSEVFC